MYFHQTSNSARTHVEPSLDTRTFRQYSVHTRHVTCVNWRHRETTVFFRISRTNQPARSTVQHWCSVHDCNSLDSEIYPKLLLCAHLCLIRLKKDRKLLFHELTPHIFTRTQCSFINNTASLCRLEDYNKTWLLPGVPRDTFWPGKLHRCEIEVQDPSNSCFYFREEICRSICQVHLSSHKFGLLHIHKGNKGIHPTRFSSSLFWLSPLYCVSPCNTVEFQHRQSLLEFDCIRWGQFGLLNSTKIQLAFTAFCLWPDQSIHYLVCLAQLSLVLESWLRNQILSPDFFCLSFTGGLFLRWGALFVEAHSNPKGSVP